MSSFNQENQEEKKGENQEIQNLPLFPHPNLAIEDFPEEEEEDESNNIYSPQETEDYMREEIYQWIRLYQQEFPLTLSKPSYNLDATQAILDAVYPRWETESFIQELGKEEDIGQIIYEMVCEFCPQRYSLFSPTAPEEPVEYIREIQTWQQKVQKLQQLDAQNPKQGTTAWLKQRYDMITASDAYKALTTESQRNNIIQSKSQPFHCYGTEDEEGNRQNHNGPASMEWGHMFEPVSVQIYEHLTGEKVLFMGCIPHPSLPFLGASPDGVVSPWETDGGGCQRIQRLLEIKNPISRMIDGIPSEAYWIQQQIQMEVCDMEGCDFFETSFKTMDDLSALFLTSTTNTNTLSNAETDSSGLSLEMSSAFCNTENNVNDHPPTQDTDMNLPSQQNLTNNTYSPPVSEQSEPSLYYGVIAEYKYHKWGERFPSTKYLYLPPLTPLSGNIPAPLPKPIPAEEDVDSDMEECSIWNLDSEEEEEEETESETDEEQEQEEPPFSGNFHYVIDIKSNEYFDNLDDLQHHIDKQIPKNHPEAKEYTFSKKIHWKLENTSLIYVERNREWFEAAKPKLQEVWETIQQIRLQIQSITPSVQEPDTKQISIPYPSRSCPSSNPCPSSNSLPKNQKSLKDWFV